MTDANKTIDKIRTFHPELTAIRRDIHTHPEIGMTEVRTADLVAKLLESWGIEVHRNVGKTGVVGVLRNGNGPGRIGLRADMDALPIVEATGVPYASQTKGVMHACGHDGHTTMLLGAAKYLAETKSFNGTVNFIFQPGEEGMGGALAMLEDKLFERFPCDEIFGMHNAPGMPVGQFAIAPGTGMAGGAFFDITITGKGAHGARPEDSLDPVVAACQIGSALQTVVARNVPPLDMGVVSITKIQSGDAYNVIPQSAVMGGTVRTMKRETMTIIEKSMKRVVEGVAAGLGVQATFDFRLIFAPLINSKDGVQAIADTAAALVGDKNVDRHRAPATASEDFAFMLEKVPGAYINVGNGVNSAPVHNHKYDFNDEIIPLGSALYAHLIERKLVTQPGAM